MCVLNVRGMRLSQTKEHEGVGPKRRKKDGKRKDNGGEEENLACNNISDRFTSDGDSLFEERTRCVVSLRTLFFRPVTSKREYTHILQPQYNTHLTRD